MLAAIFVILSSMLVIGLGTFVVYRHFRVKLRFWFFWFCLSLSLWQLTVLASERLNTNPLFWNRITFIGPMLAGLFLWMLIGEIRKEALGRSGATTRRYYAANLIIILLIAINVFLALTPYIVSGIEPRYDSHGIRVGYDIDRGLGYVIYIATFILLAVISAVELIYIRQKSTKKQSKRQINSILIAIVITAAVGAVTSILVPLLLESSQYSYLGSISVLIFSFILSFSIIKYKVIDVQFVVARSLAYFASLGIVVALFTALAFYLSAVFFEASAIPLGVQLLLAAFTAVAALAFQPIKQFFDKVSNSIFYRDAYDSQVVINKINSNLVNTTQLNRLLSTTASIIQKELNVAYAIFSLHPVAGVKISTNEHLVPELSQRDYEGFINKSYEIKSKIILAGDPALRSDVITHLQRINAGCAVKMRSNNQDVGIFVVGDRKSGNGFATRDIQLLEIIADEVAIAVQNALRLEEISQFNITLQKKIDDATRQLKRTNDKLRALDEAKDDFVSMASHQLRTPLTSVKGYLSMVLEGDAGSLNEQQRLMLDQAFNSSQRMTYLMSDLLNLSRLKTGKFVIENKPTNLAKVITQELGQVQAVATARNLTMSYNEPEDFPVFMLDDTKIRQVIMNFVDNAIYYTPSGGEITIKLEQTDHAIEFTVHDTGIGVSKEDQHNLFTKFYRAPNAKKVRPDGTGLGLFMARKVIAAQGGAITFHSQVGKGSTFGFSFPKTLAATSAQKLDEQ